MSAAPPAGSAGIVTGGGGGIGAAVAQALVEAGADVLVADRDGAAADAVAQRLGDRAVAREVDVTCPDAIDEAVAACADRFGAVDFVIANAGIGWAGRFEDADADAWRRVLEVNVVGMALTLRAALPTMRARGRGHLVVTASVSGITSYSGETVYVASKWAVIGLVRSLRLELAGSGVRITTVEPGLVDTPMARRSPVAQEAFAQLHPLQPDDIAAAVLYALGQPRHVDVNEIVVRPHGQGI